MLRVTAVTRVASTVTVQGELVTPSVEAVIVAVPSLLADNCPFDTLTTEGSLLVQKIVSYSAAAGSTVAVNVLDSPTFSVTLLSLSLTPETSGSHWQEEKTATNRRGTILYIYFIIIIFLETYPHERAYYIAHGLVIVCE